MSWEEVLKRNQELEEVAVKLKKALEEHHKALLDLLKFDSGNFIDLSDYLGYLHTDPYDEILDEEALAKSMKKQFDSFMKEFDNIVENTSDTFEKEAGGVSFGGHGANPELFNIKYGGEKRGKKRRKEKVRD
tara:strand:+ start:1020 stop:1415 length:396 start_codon:yes stop_codon:yes gene_type:complete